MIKTLIVPCRLVILLSVTPLIESPLNMPKIFKITLERDILFLARRGRMSSERYCHTPGVVVVVVVVVVDNFRLKFLFINLSQVKVSVY